MTSLVAVYAFNEGKKTFHKLMERSIDEAYQKIYEEVWYANNCSKCQKKDKKKMENGNLICSFVKDGSELTFHLERIGDPIKLLASFLSEK